MKILLTGGAGFIGSFTAQKLAERGDCVVMIDNLNDYYSPRLKLDRLAELGIQTSLDDVGVVGSTRYPQLQFRRLDLADRNGILALFASERFDKVCNLAAQAGVRYSIENPYAYADSNLTGFLNILEGCRQFGVKHLIYASSSSVYGANSKVPFAEQDRTDDPVSLYAATKKAGELMAHTYHGLYGFATTGLRFFTVYGPWGRPDMAPMLFARTIAGGDPIRVFNGGNMMRDFTFIDDIVEGVVRVIEREPVEPCGIYNIGAGHPVPLMDFIALLERELGVTAQKIMLPMQPGDVYQTYADTSRLTRDYGYTPRVQLDEGIRRFIAWYKNRE